MHSIIRRVVDLAFPKGPPYEPRPDGYMEKYRYADAENLEYIRSDVKNLAYMRDPLRTPCLSDLELELGKTDNQTLSEDTRRTLLRADRYKKKTTGNVTDLQSLLDSAGFDLKVYQNSPDGPAIDPCILLNQNFQMQALGGTNYYAGNTLAYAGALGGELLVNGAVFDQAPAYTGAGDIYAGNGLAVAGYFARLKQTPIEYQIPTDPDSWPFVFFVGSEVADINPTTGEIISIEQGLVPSEQRKQLEDIILKFKPLFTWCGLIVTFT